jgi:ribosomal protein S18 acetylase RimI-like enzyme
MEIKKILSTEAHLVTDLFDQYRVFYQQPSDKRLAGQFIHDRLANNESVIFLAYTMQDNQVVPAGFTQLYPTYSSVRAVKNWILNDLYVENGFRRKGVGEKLIRAAMEFAKEEKATFVQLETAIDNHTAQSLYEHIGFKKQEPGSNFFVYRIPLF